ncbi:MAG: DUF3750 domain-containing protein [Rhodospirillales bacterium]|nr:DUF3750 domain-containing protein [Rhodospirillales bacterium]
MRRFLAFLAALIPLAFAAMPKSADWRSASREPVGLAPSADTVREAIVQVYAARTFGWRGRFAVHSWIAVKPAGGQWRVYEVIGWRKYRGLPPLVVHARAPDARWFGAVPDVLAERRGDEASEMITRIDAAASDYPYADSYVMWPGPNSNSFVAHVLRAVPDLDCDLPPTAIGKDFLTHCLVGRAPSGTGFQVSLWGVLGLLVGAREGIELNILGLVFGIDPGDGVIKLPLLGRIRLTEA